MQVRHQDQLVIKHYVGCCVVMDRGRIAYGRINQFDIQPVVHVALFTRPGGKGNIRMCRGDGIKKSLSETMPQIPVAADIADAGSILWQR